MCVVDECEPWAVVRSEQPTARKEYRCGESAGATAARPSPNAPATTHAGSSGRWRDERRSL